MLQASVQSWWDRRARIERGSDRPRVTACVPSFRCNQFIARAVQSLLDQTYDRVSVIVVSDGDPDPPWDALGHIRDPRLVRFSIDRNRGPYFALAVAMHATSDPLFLMQDADDWSHPERISILIDDMKNEQADGSFSDVTLHKLGASGTPIPSRLRWYPSPDLALTSEYRHRAAHHGLFRTASLSNVGGYFAGFRIGYDTLLMNLLLMTGKLSYVPLPLYNCVAHAASLTHDPETGFGSAYRQHVRHSLGYLYSEAYQHYVRYLDGRITADSLAAAIRGIGARFVSEADRRALERESARLRGQLLSRSSALAAY